jgi:hypothetical protein
MTERHGFDWRASVLLLVVAVSFAGIWFLPPLAQDPAYHRFTDQRELLGIPYALNIVTNLAFLLVGAAGIRLCIRWPLAMRTSWLVFFGGVVLVCFGSGYYHARPDNDTLVWDRLPMSVAFMGLFVAVISEAAGAPSLARGPRLDPIGEAAGATHQISGRTSEASRAPDSARGPRLDPIGKRISPRLETLLLVPAVVAGIASVLYWHYADDLRLYVWVQFMPLLVIALVLVMFPAANRRTGYLAAALALYLASKAAEYYDRAVFELTHETLSGHSLKHLLAALAVYGIVRMLRTEHTAG